MNVFMDSLRIVIEKTPVSLPGLFFLSLKIELHIYIYHYQVAREAAAWWEIGTNNRLYISREHNLLQTST